MSEKAVPTRDIERIVAWNSTAYPFQEATIHQLVTEAAARLPDQPAVVSGSGVVYSHAELERRSNQVAQQLATLGIGRGSVVGLLSDHTPEAVVALLGGLKVGAGYVPLDPRWPAGRIQGLLEQLQVECVVAGRAQLGMVFELQWVNRPGSRPDRRQPRSSPPRQDQQSRHRHPARGRPAPSHRRRPNLRRHLRQHPRPGPARPRRPRRHRRAPPRPGHRPPSRLPAHSKTTRTNPEVTTTHNSRTHES